jgi:glyoxylase-like metal-dependent hydrolase (beta-lactamase superfamily II)
MDSPYNKLVALDWAQDLSSVGDSVNVERHFEGTVVSLRGETLNHLPKYDRMFLEHRRRGSEVAKVRGCNTYLLSDNRGSAFAFEPGFWKANEYVGSDPMLQQRMKVLLSFNLTGIILGHWHWEHILAAKPLSEIGIPIYACSERPSLPQIMGFSRATDFYKKVYGWNDSLLDIPVDGLLGPDQELAVGDNKWKVLSLPGHSANMVALYSRTQRALISSDFLLVVEIKGVRKLFLPHIAEGGNRDEYLHSMRSLAELEIDWIFPGHGPVYFEKRLNEKLAEGLENGLFEQKLEQMEKKFDSYKSMDWTIHEAY